MPRNHNPGTSSLRNRNRITNKTRLKILRGPIDADPLILDEETFVSNSVQTAGVDAEETNEHHLQAVLSAASKRNQQATQRSRTGDKVTDKVAYIPVPDSTGLADNYEELYPAGRWRDPATYLATSATVEECCTGALANGFTYYLDERDKEWLDKNNEEARGEGTSTQGAVSASASGTTRTSARSAKAKGKEPEWSQPVVVSEDLFELVMGLYEKITHEKTEHLHLSLNTGMAFPAFADYQDVFASPLLPSFFATFTLPPGIPPPTVLLSVARLVYPHWKERRLERGGLRIIPALNGDELDTLNESYVCFRRREIKAVRKTRASQVTSSDKLARLQTELAYPLEMAKALLSREMKKKESIHNAQVVWEKRMALADLKRKFPALGDRADEELLYDKERVAKKPKVEHRLKLRPNDPSSPAIPVESAIRPTHRAATIHSQVERELAKQKDRDHHWEDSVDNAYQPLPIPFASRVFKYISTDTSDTNADRRPRALRHRLGRGGRTWVDRRTRGPSPRLSSGSSQLESFKSRRHRLPSAGNSDGEEDSDEVSLEDNKRLASRWRFDDDDCPPVGPYGLDEMDRVLVDDYDSRHLRSSMKLFSDADLNLLMTDNTITITHPDGRQQAIVPYRLGMNAVHQVRREPPRPPPGVIPPHMLSHPPPGSPSTASPVINGISSATVPNPPNNPFASGATPIALSTQVKKMSPGNISTVVHQTNGVVRPPSVINGVGSGGMRAVSSDGSSMRPPLSTGSSPVVSSMPSNIPPSHSSPPHAHPIIQHPSSTGVNGVNRGAINMPHIDMTKTDIHLTPTPNALMNLQALQALQGTRGSAQTNASPEPPLQVDGNIATNGVSPIRPQSQNQNQQSSNGYHTKVAGFTNGTANSAIFNVPQGGLSHQQLQDLKSAFANSPATQDLSVLSQAVNGNAGRTSVGVPYVQVPNGSTFNVQLGLTPKLAAARHMQWSASMLQRTAPTGLNGVGVSADGVPHVNGAANGNAVSPPNVNPTRSPSRAGTALGMRPPAGVGIAHTSPNRVSQSMSPHLQHNSPPLNHSSPLPSPVPLPAAPSPSIQHQQTVHSVSGGF